MVRCPVSKIWTVEDHHRRRILATEEFRQNSSLGRISHSTTEQITNAELKTAGDDLKDIFKPLENVKDRGTERLYKQRRRTKAKPPNPNRRVFQKPDVRRSQVGSPGF
jgi:hypothetical protein